MRCLAIVISLFFCNTFQLLALDGALNSKVNLPEFKGKVSSYLYLIEENSNVFFSYNPSELPVDSIIYKREKIVRIEDLLEEVFGSKYRFLESGKYLTIKPKKQKTKPPKEATKKKYVITGRVINSRTGEVVKEAVIYDNNKLFSTTTNSEGYYNLTVSSKNDFIPITISSSEFYDTLIVVEPYESEIDTIGLIPIYKAKTIDGPKINDLGSADSNKVENLGIVSTIVPKVAFSQTNYQPIIIERPAQISFLPILGTNRKLSGMVENKASLNVLAGYSGAVNGVEVGGLINIVRYDVRGFQAAGLGNITGGKVKGAQVAGLFNNNRGSIDGMQISGFYNFVSDTVKGAQIAGFSNILNGKMDGIQLAGFSNITTKNVDGVQISGFGNVALGDVDLMQLAGFSNYGNNVGGGQIAGFMNLAKESVGGGQIAGFTNIAGGNIGGWQLSGAMNISSGRVKGGQISGLINVANQVEGFQISPFNFSDSCNGVPIGLMSIVRSGYHSFGLRSNELALHKSFFRTGVSKFYNLFSFGVKLGENPFFSMGYGFGSLKQYNNRWNRHWEVEFSQLKSYNSVRFEFNMLSNVRLLFAYKPFKWMSLEFGPQYNHHMRDVLPPNEPYMLAPYNDEPFVLGDTEWTHWIGASAALSIQF
ncbi:MAG: hypothetical protein JXQ87_01240 [Bacteroidia bacterium]